MKKVNKTRFAILGMLFEKSHSGYSLLHMMHQSTANFWQESDASIYPMLKKLETEKLVTAKNECTGKRERTIFEITPAGKDVFLAWMALPAEKENNRNEFLLKLFFGAATTKDTIIKQLALQQQKAREALAAYKKINDSALSSINDAHTSKLFWSMTLHYGIAHAQAHLQWLNECIKMLENQKT